MPYEIRFTDVGGKHYVVKDVKENDVERATGVIREKYFPKEIVVTRVPPDVTVTFSELEGKNPPE